MSIAVVTDSTADLPPEVIEKNHIEVIPAMLVIGDQAYADGQGISREEFYRRLPMYENPPTTSSASLGMFQEIYEKLFMAGATQIISIHPPATLSSLINVARLAAQSFKNRVEVLDSGLVTLGQGFQVIAAAEAATRNLSMDDILSVIANLTQRVRFLALLDTLEYVRRSGRINWATAAVSNFFNLKVMIEVKRGQVMRLGLFKSRSQGLAQLIRYLHAMGPIEQLALVYTQLADRDELRQVLESVSAQIRQQPIIAQVTTVIGTHVGPNGIGFIAVSTANP
ncbi:MAG: DegV family protein [Chloroflexi bacterium]|nr:DegV family protein [Chloroflexota bacterium]